jgi:hypothetical protein
MTMTLRNPPSAAPSDELLRREARRILRRLSEPGACLAVARDMETAVVVRDTGGGQNVRTAVLDRAVAEAMALKDWISCAVHGRVSRYQITAAGRAALKRLIAESSGHRDSFAGQHRDMEDRTIQDDAPDAPPRRVRYNAARSWRSRAARTRMASLS